MSNYSTLKYVATNNNSQIDVLDAISFDGSQSYTLTKNSSAFNPVSAANIMVSINGVVQSNNFTVTGTSIDFGEAVPGTSVCDWIIHLGVGNLNVPIDGSVTTAKIADDAVTKDKVSNLMYPAFEAILSSDTSMSDLAVVKVPADTEIFDTDSCYDNSTNYRFTPNVAGKYFVYVRVFIDDVSNNTNNVIAYLYKNGSHLADARINFDNNPGEAGSPTVTQVVDMNGSTDYLEAYGLGDFISGGGTMKGSSVRLTTFGAFRIGD